MIGTAATVSCILSKFYIKPQLFAILIFLIFSCILSKFYIKPQPCSERDFIRTVVSYRNSTSNHNFVHSPAHEVEVVSYRNSTSNHNQGTASNFGEVLYLIEILHQTTTMGLKSQNEPVLYLIEILHQTTTLDGVELTEPVLYLIEILHQTTTNKTTKAKP